MAILLILLSAILLYFIIEYFKNEIKVQNEERAKYPKPIKRAKQSEPAPEITAELAPDEMIFEDALPNHDHLFEINCHDALDEPQTAQEVIDPEDVVVKEPVYLKGLKLDVNQASKVVEILIEDGFLKGADITNGRAYIAQIMRAADSASTSPSNEAAVAIEEISTPEVHVAAPLTHNDDANTDAIPDEDDFGVFNFSQSESASNQEGGVTLTHFINPNPVNSNATAGALSNEIGRYEGSFFSHIANEQEKSTNKEIGRWIKPEQPMQINKRIVPNGFFYYGGVLPSLSGELIEPSLVDPKLKASQPQKSNSVHSDHFDDQLSEWSSYASISPANRGIYLDWLASDRSTIPGSIHYLTIYLGGIERRVFEILQGHEVTADEIVQLYEEVLRLYYVPAYENRFCDFASDLMQLMAIFYPDILMQRHKQKFTTEALNQLQLKIKLGTQLVEHGRIDAQQAYAWMSHWGYSLRSTAAQRCAQEFKKLFTIRFNDLYPKGLAIKANKTKLQIPYFPINTGNRGLKFYYKDLPDIGALSAPCDRFEEISKSVVSILQSYSRYLGQSGKQRTDLEAILLLPKELSSEAESPKLEALKAWMMLTIQEHNGVSTTREILTQGAISIPNSFNLSIANLFSSLMNKLEMDYVPNTRCYSHALSFDEPIIFFHAPTNGDKLFFPEPSFHAISLGIRLSLSIATIAGARTEHKIALLKEHIQNTHFVNPIERQLHTTYIEWLTKRPINLNGIKPLVAKLESKHLQHVKPFLLAMCASDRDIDPKAINQLQKCYTILGFDKNAALTDIHNVAAGKLPPDQITDHVGANQLQSKSVAPKAFSLNEDIIAQHESDTHAAKSMLESIFVDDTEVELAVVENTELINSNGGTGLDEAHNSLYVALIQKQEWSRTEALALCKTLNLMLDGAIETINDWAYSKVDAPVLDDDGDICIDQDIVEELKG
ncbi:TerB N-terminal domain-containing protein [Rheinheimera sp. D18]|uniref:TerB N-terminal domain-containing protein n=1 Tax=Rheinheimera sp. D18 TaxID=2545632 RepID=UPI0014042FF5|nr:TerB N-terminal domain-containing protein [Rheinheimera sp. D18]